ncbi:MAG: efflux RND transporter periplasmic adaptor subunit [Trueperaceae bacterium]|nr:efflux RND transporter periplasmic adaptor subunit [Trueperaceae bacterium]
MTTKTLAAFFGGVVLTLAAVFLVLASSQNGSSPNSARRSAANQIVPVAQTQQTDEPVRQVRAITAQAGSLSAVRSASVTIEPAQESQVSAGTGGRVEAVLRRAGGMVEQGDTVVRLDDSTLQSQLRNAQLSLESAQINLASSSRANQEAIRQLQASVAAAQANLDALQTRYQESRALLDVGGIAPVEVTSLESQLAQARSSLIQAQSQLAQSQRAGREDLALLDVQVRQARNQVAQARDALAETRVSAPFSGEIGDIMVEEGEFVGAGTPVFSLVNNTRQLARFRVPPEDAQQLAERDLIYIRYGGLDYASFVVRSSPVPGQQQRLVEITTEIYPSDTPIPPGSVAELRYERTLAEGVIVPSGAITAEGGQNYVFVVRSGRAARTEVRVLAEASGEAAVEGVEAGSRVIFPLPIDLRDGARIEVVGS